MTDIVLPSVPVGLTVLINFFAPHLVSLVISPLWATKTKQLVAVGVAVVLTIGAMALAYFGFHVPLGANPALIILVGVVTLFAAYDVVWKQLADQLTVKAGVGTQKAELTPAPVSLDTGVPDISSIGVNAPAASDDSVTSDGTV